MSRSQAFADRAQLTAERLNMPAGGGRFAISRLALGLFLVDQERHKIAIGSDKREHVPLKAGEGWILPAGATGTCEYDEALSFLRLEVPEDLLADVGFEHSDFRPMVGAFDPLLVQLAHQTVSIAGHPPSLYRETMQLALAAHLARFLAPARRALIGVEDRRLRRTLDYIHDNLTANLSLEGMAAEAAMSRFHFARAFTRALGRSPLQYVIHERMELAKLFLKTTRLPISSVAARVGYEDLSRFGQHFRRHAGTTPAAFRAN
ncbi:AraC family transcriptional regulator [Neorhizobium galegae]|uniref:AraC family transcriptional regulator n=1 Tax=Neorhizobium galegae TaxID=399 RepID=UPI0027889677|nr:AraC family transcriptional regulator [Neorhizobium galegae]MDQ0132490.1 AraC family transcriptional regulator [Neorhizobium galegae]